MTFRHMRKLLPVEWSKTLSICRWKCLIQFGSEDLPSCKFIYLFIKFTWKYSCCMSRTLQPYYWPKECLGKKIQAAGFQRQALIAWSWWCGLLITQAAHSCPSLFLALLFVFFQGHNTFIKSLPSLPWKRPLEAIPSLDASPFIITLCLCSVN